MASQYPINVLTQLPTEGGYILHEKSVLAYWKQIDAYKRVQEHQETSTDVFELLDGPPFVSSSNLHAGHLSVPVAADAAAHLCRDLAAHCAGSLP